MTPPARWRPLLVFLVAALAPGGAAWAVVESVVVEARLPVLGNKPFGPAGPYEKLIGRIHFSFDPANPANRAVTDVERAPRNAAGRVEAWAHFMVLKPRRSAPGRVALIEVSNRGGKAALGHFNYGTYATNPSLPGDFGDDFLMRMGLTVIWVGWQFDVPRVSGLLRLHVPVATEGRQPITGPVRSDWTVDQTVNTLPLGHRDHIPYQPLPARDGDAVLTVRDGRLAPPRVVPRQEWSFARDTDEGPKPDREHLFLASGFQAGKIYELVYVSAGPRLVGLGLAAIRDVAAYVKHDPQSLFGAGATVALGISQSGRFLRHFLYQGFNADERGRRAIDGMLIHAAGAGRGSFNHRFAQPSRDGHRYSAFFYPTDLFPFASGSLRDPETGVTDGLLTHALDPAHRPRIISTNTGYEYWGRAASLLHTTPDASADVESLPDERIYHLAGAQHFVMGFPPEAGDRLEGSPAYRGNPLDFRPSLRVLLVRLVEWVTRDKEPPPSVVPRLASATLVPPERLSFPPVRGLTSPRVVNEPYRLDYGPRWAEGIVTLEPPRLGKAFPALVPQVDELGNEVGGLRAVDLLVPVATFAPWSLRSGQAGAAEELRDFYGTYIPLPRTEAERESLGDPRPSLERLYPGGQPEYVERVRMATTSLQTQRLLLPEDATRILRRARRQWDWIHQRSEAEQAEPKEE